MFVYELSGCRFESRCSHRCFPVQVSKFLRTPILKKICGRLLLIMDAYFSPDADESKEKAENIKMFTLKVVLQQMELER